MRRALPLLLLLTLIGCKGSREKDVVGTWTLSSGSVTLDEAKTYRGTMGPMTMDGIWSIEGNDVTLTRKNLNGKPIAELKAQLQKNMGAVPAQAKAFVEDIDKPSILTLSEDGKSMTTNKAKDKNSGPAMTLTKSP